MDYTKWSILRQTMTSEPPGTSTTNKPSFSLPIKAITIFLLWINLYERMNHHVLSKNDIFGSLFFQINPHAPDVPIYCPQNVHHPLLALVTNQHFYDSTQSVMIGRFAGNHYFDNQYVFYWLSKEGPTIN
jgi:hypothetical protein